MLASEPIRLATVGTSAITVHALEALAEIPNVVHEAACSRTAERAQQLAPGVRHIPSVEALAADPAVDAVYLATPNALHAEQALQLVQAGKHVLVEKSFAATEAEAARVFAAAQVAGVQVMEAARGLYVPSFTTLQNSLAPLGTLRSASLRFAKVTSRIKALRENQRVAILDPRCASGALMDIGVYCVAAAAALFGAPKTVQACAQLELVPGEPADSPYAHIDVAGEVLLSYEQGPLVALSYGKAHDDHLSCQIAGEQATLLWDNIAAPRDLRCIAHEDKGMVYGTSGGAVTPIATEELPHDMTGEFTAFFDAILNKPGARNRLQHSHEITRTTLHICDEVRKQIGVRFPADAAV